jgi:hypothetical protein
LQKNEVMLAMSGAPTMKMKIAAVTQADPSMHMASSAFFPSSDRIYLSAAGRSTASFLSRRIFWDNVGADAFRRQNQIRQRRRGKRCKAHNIKTRRTADDGIDDAAAVGKSKPNRDPIKLAIV